MIMRVKIGNAANPTNIEDALTPRPSYATEQGALEEMRAHINSQGLAIGRRLAMLIEHRVLQLDEACECAGRYETIAPWIDDDDIPF